MQTNNGNDNKDKTQNELDRAGLEMIEGPAVDQAKRMLQDGRRIQVLGRFKDGKLELDQASLDEMTRRYPDADMAFIAVNAPFDPVQLCPADLAVSVRV